MYKGTYFMTFKDWGWSESWWLSSTSLQAAWNQMNSAGESRQLLMGYGGVVSAIRVLDSDSPRASLLKRVSYAPLSAATLDNIIDNPYNAIYVSVTDGLRKYRRQMWMRGVADSWIRYGTADQNPILSPTANQNLAAFAVKALAALFQIRAINADLVAAPLKKITGISLQAVTQLFVIACPNHGYATGDYVRIKGCKGVNLTVFLNTVSRSVNGVWPITRIDADSFSIPLPGSPTNPPIYTGGGTSQIRSVVYRPVSFIDYQKYSKRDTGHPTGQPRGRRKAVRQSVFTPVAKS